MGILGTSIGLYLKEMNGLYSVELPTKLRPEILDLVNICNADTPTRALFVVGDEETLQFDHQVRWSEMLGWRTNDDRIFVWERGNKEPDTSFTSAVKPFISSRFPGSPTGECSLELLARLTVQQLFINHSLATSGETFKAFQDTASWVIGVLKNSFEKLGNSLGSHWSDDFLIHWTETTRLLEGELDNLISSGNKLEARHAWDIVRLSGLPVPEKLMKSGNPFLLRPDDLDGREWGKFANQWQTIVDENLKDDTTRASFLTMLDNSAKGERTISSWRDLDWMQINSIPNIENVAAPVIGQKVFASEPSPSIMLATPLPQYPASPKPSWWGVTEHEINEAISSRNNAVVITPLSDCPALVSIPGQEDTYLLDTRRGIISPEIGRTWATQVNIDGINVEISAPWKRFILSTLPVDNSRREIAWINPDEIVFDSGRGLRITQLAVERKEDVSTDKLILRLTAGVRVDTRVVKGHTGFEAKWNPLRAIKMKLTVHDVLADSTIQTRNIDAIIKLIIPSPFFPTVLALPSKRKLYVAPDSKDSFLLENDTWVTRETPDILLKEEENCSVWVYDGSISPSATSFNTVQQVQVNDTALQPMNDRIGFFRSNSTFLLDDDDVISGDQAVLAVVKVKERSDALSSGLLSVIRGLPAGQKAPSKLAQDSVLGKFQDNLTEGIGLGLTGTTNSLYQYVLLTGETSADWIPHPGTALPQFIPASKNGLDLPELGDGPSTDLVLSDAWKNFMVATRDMCVEIGLSDAADPFWLSGIDPGKIQINSLKRFVDTHLQLIRTAKELSKRDAFWACYPFSMLVVEGSEGKSFGKLLSVLLSPLHPVRLAWGYSVSKIASASTPMPTGKLIGLAEGWNFPWTGFAPSVSDQLLPLVAVPIDAGPESDFLMWGALGVLRDGAVQLPSHASGLVMPWAGQTGINREVVKQALKDYLSVHPYINALEVDVRSVSEAPRSREIDDALLEFLGGNEFVETVGFLTGGIRIQDSIQRLGAGPTRDHLSLVRDDDLSRQFEWIHYDPSTAPQNADIAFIENSSVHLDITGAEQPNGVVGPLPFRRFGPTVVSENRLHQDYTTSSQADILGLSLLLAEIENFDAGKPYSLQSTPQAWSLGIGKGAKWDILGALNVDPGLLSTVITQHFKDDTRMLWEWRPSWLAAGDNSVSKRPYYVVGKIPVSLLKALEYRHGLSRSQSSEMLSALGKRGIGLASLHASGGTQESAAAGLFYAMNVLLPPTDFPLPANWMRGLPNEVFCSILPLDPIQSILEDLAGEKFRRRADLLLLVGSRTDHTHFCIIPIEVKHHGVESNPEPLPTHSSDELKRARSQLEETRELLNKIAERLNGSDSKGPADYVRHVGLAVLVELAISLASTGIDSSKQAQFLGDILNGNYLLEVSKPVLLWFAPGSMSISGTACRIVEDNDLNEIYIDPSAIKGLWWSNFHVGPDENRARTLIDTLLGAALSKCSNLQSPADSNIEGSFKEFLGYKEKPDPESVIRTEPDSKLQEQVEQKIADDLAGEQATEVNIDTKLGFPHAFLGWSSPTTRWTILGKLPVGHELVGMDLDNPKALGIFGYMGSGKSYLLGTLVESAVQPIKNINVISPPLGVVIFNYRRNATDRFELSSFAFPNDNSEDNNRLLEYQAAPTSLGDVHIVSLPGELTEARLQEYAQLPATELYFNPASLTVEDWELLMGEPGSNAVFARTIRHTLRELRANLTLETLEESVLERLKGQSRSAAELRFEFVRQYISQEKGVDFERLIRPGRVVILDLRQPLFNKEDALRFFLICSNYISRVQGKFNKLVVFDEAHEYLSEEFGEKLDARIRLMRHEGTSYIFATQDVGSIPSAIRRFLTTRFVFNLGTRENVDDLLKIAPEFEGYDLQQMQPGTCLVQSTESISGVFRKPRIVLIRPRVTKHGGTSRIFSGEK